MPGEAAPRALQGGQQFGFPRVRGQARVVDRRPRVRHRRARPVAQVDGGRPRLPGLDVGVDRADRRVDRDPFGLAAITQHPGHRDDDRRDHTAGRAEQQRLHSRPGLGGFHRSGADQREEQRPRRTEPQGVDDEHGHDRYRRHHEHHEQRRTEPRVQHSADQRACATGGEQRRSGRQHDPAAHPKRPPFAVEHREGPEHDEQGRVRMPETGDDRGGDGERQRGTHRHTPPPARGRQGEQQRADPALRRHRIRICRRHLLSFLLWRAACSTH
ncbi:hypothetical protein [Nocardia arthritidis]|uniref:hypothetical protein n=1 Tax=Nocardia arthritidis TaxID=228602 RepID=UPI001FE210AE|nr:hypothetical protein [Nocardia arthritidis]